MTDIVERLRFFYETHPICTEAADEIERLRAALEQAAELGDTLVSGQVGTPDYNKGLWDGIAKMQAAVRELVRKTCADKNAP
jgi:hypothetical protein